MQLPKLSDFELPPRDQKQKQVIPKKQDAVPVKESHSVQRRQSGYSKRTNKPWRPYGNYGRNQHNDGHRSWKGKRSDGYGRRRDWGRSEYDTESVDSSLLKGLYTENMMVHRQGQELTLLRQKDLDHIKDKEVRKEEHKEEIRTIKQEHTQEMQELKRDHKEEVNELKNQMQQLQRENTRLSIEATSRQNEVQNLRYQVDESRKDMNENLRYAMRFYKQMKNSRLGGTVSVGQDRIKRFEVRKDWWSWDFFFKTIRYENEFFTFFN